MNCPEHPLHFAATTRSRLRAHRALLQPLRPAAAHHQRLPGLGGVAGADGGDAQDGSGRAVGCARREAERREVWNGAIWNGPWYFMI